MCGQWLKLDEMSALIRRPCQRVFLHIFRLLGVQQHVLNQVTPCFRHNLVVFRGGENALRDLQPLLGVIPEARLNLVIFHLKKGDTQLAFDLIKGLDASLPQACYHSRLPLTPV